MKLLEGSSGIQIFLYYYFIFRKTCLASAVQAAARLRTRDVAKIRPASEKTVAAAAIFSTLETITRILGCGVVLRAVQQNLIDRKSQLRFPQRPRLIQGADFR